MGARSQIAGLLAAGAIVLVLLFLTAPIASLPKAVLGAVIITAAIGLIEPAVWRELADADKVELAIAAVTAGGVILDGRARSDHLRGGPVDDRRRPPQRAPP